MKDSLCRNTGEIHRLRLKGSLNADNVGIVRLAHITVWYFQLLMRNVFFAYSCYSSNFNRYLRYFLVVDSSAKMNPRNIAPQFSVSVSSGVLVRLDIIPKHGVDTCLVIFYLCLEPRHNVRIHRNDCGDFSPFFQPFINCFFVLKDLFPRDVFRCWFDSCFRPTTPATTPAMTLRGRFKFHLSSSLVC